MEQSNISFTDSNIPNSNTTSYHGQRIMVDLHGLSAEKSRERVNWHLSVAEQTQTETIRFVTGRGNHVNSRGERGTLYREFPNWLSEANINKISTIKKYDGYYEISMKPTLKNNPIEEILKQLANHCLIEDLEMIRELAEKGDASYQYILGHCYHHGIGCEQNYQLAVKWYKESVNKGNPWAQYDLGGCYWQGQGVRQSDQKAIELFEKAAAQNFVWAFHQLGDVYFYGIGVEEDLARGRYYYQKASDSGVDIAKRKLGHIYYYGHGVPKDEQRGFLLYKEVADNGDAHSAYNVACAYHYGEGAGKNDELAFKYAKLAADHNDPDAQYLTYVFYSYGIGTRRDPELGYKYLVRAANNNFKHALFILAFHPKNHQQNSDYMFKAAKAGQVIAQAIVLAGLPDNALPSAERQTMLESFWKQKDEDILSIPDDYYKLTVIDAYYMLENLTKKQKAKLVGLLKALVDQGCLRVLARLGLIYHEGKIVTKDSKKAEQYWQMGAALNERNCLCALGYYYEERGEIDNNAYKEAFHYHEKAAKLGSANSCNKLGLLYKYGKGVEKNIPKAIECFHNAMHLEKTEQDSKQQQSLFYNPSLPHAAYNLANVYWYGDKDFPCNRTQACIWYIQAAEAGSKDAQKILKLIGLSKNDEAYQVASKINFWAKPQSMVKQEKIDPMEALKKIADLLNINVTWKTSKDDRAWCYIEESQLNQIKGYSLEPFAIRETTKGKYILLVEKFKSQNFSDLINRLEGQYTKLCNK